MSDYANSLLNQYANAPAPTGAVVAQSSIPKLSRDQLTAAVVGARRGAGVNRNLEHDLMSLNDADLTKIYGPGFDVFRNDLYTEALDQRKTMGTQRDPVSFVTDSLAQAAAGGIGFVGDMATLASGIPTRIGGKDYSLSGKPMSESDKQIPMAIAEATDWAVDGLTSLTSNEYQDRVRLGEFASKYESDKNNQERDAAIAAGGSPTLENWRGIGKNFLDAGEIYTSDSMLASGIVSGALGSVLPSAKLVGFARSLITESAAYKAAQLAGAISPQGMPKLMSKLTEYTANGFTASAVGVTEAASTYSQTLQDVMDLPVEDLLKSPEYFHLIENGVDPFKARMQVAENAAEDSFFTALPLATASSLLSLKFDAAPLTVFKDGMKKGLSGVGRGILGETTEELLQGASGQYAQNSAIKSNINKNQDLTAGVGEQAAMGAIGGAGMSGAIAGPGAALRTTQNISEALIDSVIGKKQTPATVVPEVLSDVTVAAQKAAKAEPSKLGTAISSATDTLKQTVKDTVAAVKPSLKAGAVVAAIELGQIAPLVQTAKEKLSAGFSKTKEVAGPYIEAGVNKSTDVVNQVSSKVGSEIKNAATNAEVATRDWIANTNEKNLPKGVAKIIEPADVDTPDDLVGVVQPKTDVLSTVNNIVRGLIDSKINARTLSDSAVLYVQSHVEKLRAALPTLPTDVREQVEKVLTSPQLKYVAAKLQDIDMTKAVGKTVADVKRMARLNPGNTNPDEIDRILKQENKDLTDEDVKNLTAARDIAIALNNHSTRKVTVNQGDKGVTLGAKVTQSDEPLTASEVVSRSVQVDGLPGLRSVGQYAADIMRGGQNEDGIFVDDKGGKVDSKNVAKQLTMFVQHMINKVDALNRSHAAGGKNLGFESLYKGQMMVPAQDARSAKSVAYHPGNDNSMKNAQAIHNDAQAAVDVYNILVDRFPEKFPDGPKDLMDLEGTMKDIASQETPEAKPKVMDEVKADGKKYGKEALKDVLLTLREIFDAALAQGAKGNIAGASISSIDFGAIKVGAEAFVNGEVSAPKMPSGEAQILADFGFNKAKNEIERLGYEPITEDKAEEVVKENILPVDLKEDAKAATPETPTTVIDEISTPVEIEEVGVSSEGKPLNSLDNLPVMFHEIFTERAEEAQFNNARELLNLVETQVPDSQGFVDFVLQYAAPIYSRMNARLSQVKYSSKGGSTILEQFQKDDSILKIKRFKPLMFVNKETGKYDPRILSLAVTSVLDYLSGAHSSSSAVLQDSLDENRVLTSDMSEQQLKDYMQSVSIRQVVETMARKLPDMLNLEVNSDARMGDIRGSLEGLIKEVFTVTAQVTDLIEIRKVPVKTVEYTDEDGTEKSRNALTPAIILTQALKNYQKLIGLNGKQAVTQLLNPEDLTGPTLNKPPETVAQTQNRGGVRLSTFEKEVQKNMQSISHTLAPVAKFVTDLGEDMLFDLLGGKDVGSIHDDHPYRRSVEGKNLSIRNDYQDAIEIVDAILGAETGDKIQVFYPVGITRVGRHQMKGPNPQNNKILRVFVTPTHATLDMKNNQQHKDWFWLTVAQASGLAKAEKHDHMKIYAETEAKFREKYSEAVGIALEYLRTGEMNQEGFKNAMAPFRKAGAVTMAQINSVFAVAALDYAKTKNDPEALQKFETSLSFELDGLTDGPGNMMVNFGQGYVSPQDFQNLRRVGYFLGEHDMTTNQFYTQQGAQDFYEVTTNTGQSILAQMRGKFSSEVDAVVRFAARFGDLEVMTNEDGSLSYQMTRNTAKGPVTKTVYGSSAKGIAEGLGQEMLNEFYRTMIEDVGSNNPSEVLLYPELEQDFALLFGDKFPKGKDWKLTWVDDKGKNIFVDTVKETLAQAMSEAAKHSIGDKITRVNDSLVFVTNVQAQFLKFIFESRLQKLLLNDPSVERRNGKPVFETLSMQKFMGLVKEVSKLAPSYFNGVQTLNIGSFEGTVSDNIEFSDNFEEGMRMKSSVLEPGDAGVKVIPYITQGRGDAMMMNYIYGKDNFPKKSIYVFDGVEIPIDLIGEYSKQINEAVAENWRQNVLQDVVADYTRFLDSMPEEEKSFLSDAFELVLKNQSKNSMARFESVNGILGQLQNFAAQNKARKDAIEEMPRSVNHMAGANDSVNLGPEGNLSLDEINDKIKEKFSDPTPLTKEEEAKAAAQFDKLAVTTGVLLLDALAKVKMNKRLAAVVGVLRAAKPDVRVVVGSPAQILAHRLNEEVTNASKPPNGQGFYDPLSNTIYLMSTAHETMVHELVHAITLSLVQKVYEGSGSVAQNGAVERLEILMGDFLEMDFSKASKAAQRAAKTTKGEILRAQGMNDIFGKTKALNEFMAWTLANDALSRELNNTVTGMVTQMIKKVRALMARILGTVSHDMFSNILFNTQVLLEQEEKVQSPTIDVTIGGKTETIQIGQDEEEDFDLTEDWDETGVFSSNNDGGNGGNGDNGPSGRGPQSPAQGPTNFWINLITKKIDEMKAPSRFRREKLTELNKYIDNSQKAFDVLVSGGYIFNYEQELTFKAIHMMLAFEMNLNANSLVAMNKMFNFVTDNLAPAMFAVDGQNKYQAMMDSFGGTKNTQGVSDAIATFFALSQTSNDYRGALDNLPKPPAEGGMKFSSFNEFVASSATILMRQAVGEIQTGNVEAKAALDALSKSILNQDTQREYTALRSLMSSFDSADRFTKGALRKLAEFGESVNRKTPNTNKLLKTITQSVNLATGLFDERKAADSFEAAKLLTHAGTDLSWAIPFQEFIAEMIGTDKKNSGLIAMLDITKKHVSALRQQYRDTLPVILQNEFSTKPTAEQWKAAHSSLGQSDFASVFTLDKSDLSFKVFSDQAYRDRQIENFEKAIKRQVSAGMATEILEKAQQLADQMNGKGVGHMLYANAFAINHFVGDRTNEVLVGVIDKLVTFYAINGKPQEELDAVSAMYDADPEAMKNLVVYMQALNLEEERKLQNPPETPPHLLDEDGNPLYGDPVMKMKLNGYKGYVPNFGMPDVQLTIEEDVYEDLLNKRGFIRVADYQAEDGMSFVSRGVYVSNTRQTGGYAQGVMQSIQNTYRGVNAVTGLTVNGTTSGVIVGLDQVDNYVQALNTAGTVNDPKEALRPVYDEYGVAFFERVINPDLIQKHMAPPQNLALMLGVWAGRQVEEKAAEVYNNLLVDELRSTYDSRGKMEDSMFIDIREEARKMDAYNRLTPAQRKTVKKPDAIYADSWNVIPPQTKFYIQEVFPEGFFVKKDQINTALGYAEPSITDMWTGKTRLSDSTQVVIQAISNLTLGKLKDGTSAMTLLQKGEEAVQSTVSFAKDLIVTRSLVVPYLNSQANVFNLMIRGVANKAIIKGYKEKLVEIEQYNENFKKRMYLSTQIQLNREDPNRVQILEDQIKVLDDQDRRMSIHPLIEAGAYKTISEGITEDDFEVLRGGFMDKVQEQVEKLPQVAKTIIKNGVLSRETKLYQLANKAVQYGDFIAKGVYYEHLTTVGGKTSKEALQIINEEFVNFSTPPGRVRTGLDKLGATWFLTYKIRVMKPALSQIRDNPLRALMVNAVVPGNNTAQASNLITATIDGRIGYSMGWDMLFNSPGLNPWANMMGW